MPNSKAVELAKDILDDLSGSTYYADPEILGGYLTTRIRTEQEAKSVAIALLRHLLHRYVQRSKDTTTLYEEDLQALASALEGYGVR